jgi:hypothetical protein
MNKKTYINNLKVAGFISDREAAAILGITQGGKMRASLVRKGLHPVMFNLDGEVGKQVSMWDKSEILEYAESLKNNDPVAGENNGGLLRQKIAELQQSVGELEDRISRLETSCFSA